MAFPYALIDSLLHFGKVIPSSSLGSPSSPPQTGGKVGNSSQPLDSSSGLVRSVCSLRPSSRLPFPHFGNSLSVSGAFPCSPFVSMDSATLSRVFLSRSSTLRDFSVYSNRMRWVSGASFLKVSVTLNCCTSSRSCIPLLRLSPSSRRGVRFSRLFSE